jgi:hypothetical protein
MILPQLIERRDFHKCFEEYEQAADGRAVTTKNLNPERRIFEPSPKTSGI